MTNQTNVYMVCDCSGSMAGGPEQRMRELLTENIAILAKTPGHTFQVTLVPFSDPGTAKFVFPAEAGKVEPRSIAAVNTRRPYGSGTALLDAMGLALEDAEKRINDVPALIMVFTDGDENNSRVWNGPRFKAALDRVEKTGNLTFTFMGPKGAQRTLGYHGVDLGQNFKAWDGTEKELSRASSEVVTAVSTYAIGRTRGQRKSTTFYADASQLTPAGIKAMTKEVKPTVSVVSRRMAGRAIADYFGKDFKKGAHFYELIKSEKIQDGKELVVHIKAQNEYRLGSRAVRALLGLPETGEIRVAPSAHKGDYTIFVQSDSVNRKVVEGQQMLTVEE